jgi:ketosteroid isomerase-like protein
MFRDFLLAAALCLTLPVICSAQKTNQAPSKVARSKIYKEIERLETEWNTINEVSDAEGKERLLAGDSYHIGSDGRFYDKKQDVAIQQEARKRKKAANSNVKFEITDRQIRLYKNVAIVTGLGTTFATRDGQKRMSGQFRFIHVWEKRGARWQLTIDQTTAVRNPLPVPRTGG